VSDGLFKFERDFQTDLRCIPMVVRHRLDQCGIKMSLKEWVKLGPEQRSEVLGRIDEPVERFAEAVDALVERRMGQKPARLPIEADPAWADTSKIPDAVATKAAEEGVTLTQPQWAGLAPLQRFALYKLSRSSHKNENFVPACREFGVP
jgi:hypothetical protein